VGIAYPLTVVTSGVASAVATTNIEQWIVATIHIISGRSGSGYLTNGTVNAAAKLWNGLLADGLTSKM